MITGDVVLLVSDSCFGSKQFARNFIGLESGILGVHGTASGKTLLDGVQFSFCSGSHPTHAYKR